MISFLKRNRRLLLVVSIIASLSFAMDRFVNSPLFQKFIFRNISKVLPVDLDLTQMRVGLFTGSISFKDFIIKTKKSGVIKIGQIYTRLSPLSIIRGKLVFATLDMDDVVLFLVKGEEKELSIDIQVIEENLEELMLFRSLIIDDANIKNLSIRSPQGKITKIESIQFELWPKGLTEFGWQTQIKLTGLTPPSLDEEALSYPQKPMDLSAKISLSKEGISISSFNFIRHGVEMKMKSNISFIRLPDKTKTMQLSLAGDLSFPTLMTLPLKVDSKFHLDINNRQGPSLKIDTLTATLGEGLVDVKGQLNLKTLVYDIAYQGSDLSLKHIFGNAEGVVLGYAEGVGQLEGVGKGRLPEFKLQAEAQISHLRHRTLAVERAAGQLELDWPRFTYAADVQFPSVTKAKAPCYSSGNLFCGLTDPETGAPKCRIESIDLMCSEAPIEMMLPEMSMSGLVTGSLKVTEKQEIISGNGSAIVDHAKIIGIPFQKIKTEISFRETVWKFFDGELSYSDEKSAELTQAITVEVIGEEVVFSGNPTPSLAVRGTYHLQKGKLSIDHFQYDNEFGKFSLHGETHWKEQGAPPNIQYDFNGPLPAADLIFFKQVEEASGVIHTNVHLQGIYPEDLKGEGKFTLDNVSLDLRFFRGFLAGINGDIILNQSKIILNRIHGSLDDGEFLLDGNMVLRKLRLSDLDLNLKASDFPFSIQNEMKGEMVLDLKVQGKLPDPKISGLVDITEAKYFRSFSLQDLVLKPVLSQDNAKEESQWSWLDQARLNMLLKNSGDVWIDNNLVSKIFLKGDLKVKGTFGMPLLTGSIQVLPSVGRNEGIIGLLGVRFRVVEGNIDFNNPLKINPSFDILANQFFEDLSFEERPQVSLRIKGDLDNLRIVPETSTVDQRDFSCLVLYGMTCQEARQKNKNTGGTIASALIGEQVSLMLDKSVSSDVSPDIFRLEAGGEDESTISKVTVGKSLTDRLSLEFTSDFAPEIAERTVKANYFLTDNILFSARRTRTAIEESRYRFNIILKFEVR